MMWIKIAFLLFVLLSYNCDCVKFIQLNQVQLDIAENLA